MLVESTGVLFETPEQIFSRVFQQIRPSARHAGKMPALEIRFCRFANANSRIRMTEGKLEVRITDVLDGAPAPVLEALAWILCSKLLGKPVPPGAMFRYRRFLNRRDMRQTLEQLRRDRGRKLIEDPAGRHFHLEELFEDLNVRFFGGMMARPTIGWSRRPSRTMLGHYDPSHHAIVISRLLDDARLRLALEYVLYHEMLHLRHPVEHRGLRRCVHTPEFQEAERLFPEIGQAKAQLKNL